MTRPGADLIAWYLNLDRLPVAKRWSRKHTDAQWRLCTRFAAPVINAVTCQDIAVCRRQKIVNAAPTAGEGDRLYRMLSALDGAGPLAITVVALIVVRVALSRPCWGIASVPEGMRAWLLAVSIGLPWR